MPSRRRSYSRSRRTRRRYNSTKAIRTRTNKRLRTYRRYVKVGRTLGAFPIRKTVALRYVQTISLNATASSTVVNVFRANSIFDPDYTGAGHQPMFHDLYSQIYDSYKVNYSTIRAVALNTHAVNVAYSQDVSGTTTSQGQFYALNERAVRLWILRDVQANDYPTNVDSLIEEGSRNFRWKYCPQTTTGTMPSVKMTCTPYKLLGLSKWDSTMNADVTGNPSNSCFFVVGAANLGDGSNPDSMSIQVIITYNVTYFDLKKNQAQN